LVFALPHLSGPGITPVSLLGEIPDPGPPVASLSVLKLINVQERRDGEQCPTVKRVVGGGGRGGIPTFP